MAGQFADYLWNAMVGPKTATPNLLDNYYYLGPNNVPPELAKHPDFKPGWYDQYGNIASSDVANKLQTMSSQQQWSATHTPFETPGFFGRTTPQGQAIVSANREAEERAQEAGAESLRRRESMTKALGSLPSDKWPYPNNFLGSVNAELYPNLNPLTILPQTKAGGALDTGLPRETGSVQQKIETGAATHTLQQQPTIQETETLANELRLKGAINIDPLNYKIALNNTIAQLGRQPTELEKDRIISDLQLKQAQAAETRSPYELFAAQNEAIKGAVASTRMQPFPFYTDTVNPSGYVTGPQRDPLGMNPYIAQYGAFTQGGLSLPGAPTTTTLGSGKTIQYTPPPYTEAPLRGTPGVNYGQPNVQSGALPLSNQIKIDEYPDYSFDPTTQRLYRQGVDVTENPYIGPIKDAAIKQVSEHQEIMRNASHDAVQADLKAKKAFIEAQQKYLQSHHFSSSPLATVGRTVGGSLNDLGGYVGDIFTPNTWIPGRYRHHTATQQLADTGNLIGRLGNWAIGNQ